VKILGLSHPGSSCIFAGESVGQAVHVIDEQCFSSYFIARKKKLFVVSHFIPHMEN